MLSVLPNGQVQGLARSYYEAAEVLVNADANAIPIINLHCHSIELFLKSLHLTDVATDVGDGIAVLHPKNGRGVSHSLKNSFLQAIPEHSELLAIGMPSLEHDLVSLEGVFQESRYLYESGRSLPLSTAKRVSQYLSKKFQSFLALPSEFRDSLKLEDA